MTWLEDLPPWLKPLLRPAYCFASVIVWTKNKNVTTSDHYLFYFNGEMALAACVLSATTKHKKGRHFEEKSASGWAGWRISWPWNDLAPLLHWCHHWPAGSGLPSTLATSCSGGATPGRQVPPLTSCTCQPCSTAYKLCILYSAVCGIIYTSEENWRLGYWGPRCEHSITVPSLWLPRKNTDWSIFETDQWITNIATGYVLFENSSNSKTVQI